VKKLSIERPELADDSFPFLRCLLRIITMMITISKTTRTTTTAAIIGATDPESDDSGILYRAALEIAVMYP
jgi:hypothetical protein